MPALHQRRPARKFAWTMAALAGLTVLLVGWAVTVHWPRLARHYHLRSLRDDPSLFEEYLLATSDPRGAAATLFVELDDEGKQALLDLYIREFDRNAANWEVLETLRRQVRHGFADRGALALGETGHVLRTKKGPREGGNTSSVGIGPTDPTRRERILAHLAACEGRVFRTPGMPGFEFQLRPITGEEGRVEAPSWEASRRVVPWTGRRRSVTHVCFFRVVDGS